MDFIPPDFAHIPYGSINEESCAPPITDKTFRGILIRAPEEIRVRNDEKIKLPVCGHYQLPTLPIIGATKVIHIHPARDPSATALSGDVVILPEDIEDIIPVPYQNNPIDPKLYEKSVSEGYFYLDGQRYFDNQFKSGNYEMFVTYGGFRSNSVRVNIDLK